MNLEKIANGNKVLALFMGWKVFVDDGAIQLYRKDDITKHLGTINFHSSWDTLMPVVNKIHTVLKEREVDYEDPFMDTVEDIFNIDNMYSEFLQNNIGAIYERCLEMVVFFRSEDIG